MKVDGFKSARSKMTVSISTVIFVFSAVQNLVNLDTFWLVCLVEDGWDRAKG